MFGLKVFRDTAIGFSDLLNYAFAVDDGIIIGKDGSLMAVMEYRAKDIYSSTNEERNATAKHLNQLLTKFGNGWSLQFDSVRSPINYYPDEKESHFSDTITKMIDLERRELFLYSEGIHNSKTFVTITYLPPTRAKSKIADMMFDDEMTKKDSLANKVLAYFKDKIKEFQSLGTITFLDIKQLKEEIETDELGDVHYKNHLYSFLNQAIIGDDHPMTTPNCAMYLDSLFGYDFMTGITPKIGEKYLQVVAIEGFPQESYPNILDGLSQLNIEYRWNTKFVFLDNNEALKGLNDIRKKWKQKERGMMTMMFNPHSTKLDLDAVAMVNETDNATMEVNSGLLVYGYLSTNIVIFNTDREALDESTQFVKKMVESQGFIARIEDVNAVSAYLGSLPGHIAQNIRRNLVGSLNLSHLLPISSLWQGNKHNESDKFPPKSPALAYTLSGTTPFRLNLHVGDIGHTLIFGPTGSGKSTLLALLAAQAMRYHNARIFAFDKGMSLYPLVTASGGDHYNIGGDDSSLSFAPVANISSKTDLSWAETYVLNLIELQGIKPTPQDKELVNHALKLHSENKSNSLTELISNIQSNELRSALNHYSLDGSMGHLLDAESDNLSLSNFSVFEVEELMNLKIEDAIPVLLYLFRKIEKSLDGRPTFLFLDEAWIMLGHPVFRDKIREWLKVLRKANCAVIISTQSLSDAAKSGIIDVLQESCPTKILLPNPEAFNKGTENNWGPYDYYKSFGLNEREIEIITNSIQKREYYYKSTHGSRLFDLALGEFTLAFVGASGKTDIAKIYELKKEFGRDWIVHWLEYKRVHQDFINYYKEHKNVG